MQTVAIVGVGLIGGSFALALREAGFSGDLIGVSSPAAIQAARERGAISRSATLPEAAAQADLIYLSQPVDRILETIEALAPLTRPDCLITDAGSTKAAIVEKASRCFTSGTFLGGHPIAGKERRGVEAADADLFRGKRYVLTPIVPETPISRQFRSWLVRIGAQIVEMTAGDHDAALAFTSHLPQLVSTALAATLARKDDPRLAEVFGSSLLDMTRLALSPPDIWQSILSTNQAHVAAALDLLIRTLLDLRGQIGAGEFTALFASANTFAAALRKVPYKNLPLG
jgi:prephenate dehydrogenase